MQTILVVLLATFACVHGDVTAAKTALCVSIGGSECSNSTTNLVVARESAIVRSVLLKFDIEHLQAGDRVPDVAVLRVSSALTPPGVDAFVGRVQVSIVKNEWGTGCGIIPDPIPKYEYPPRYTTALAGEEFSFNLEQELVDLLETNHTQLSLLLSPEDTAVGSLRLNQSSAKIQYTLADPPEAEAELHQSANSIEAGHEYEFNYSLPSKILNGSEYVLLEAFQHAVAIEVHQGNLEGDLIPVTSTPEGKSFDGAYEEFRGTFVANESGAVRIDVTLFGAPIRGSPATMVVLPGMPDALHCTSEVTFPHFFNGTVPFPRVGLESCFTVRIRDQWDNAAMSAGEVKLEIIAIDTGENVSHTRESVSLGLDKFCFVPTLVGDLSIQVSLNDTDVPGFPVTVQSFPGHLHHMSLDLSNLASDEEPYVVGTTKSFGLIGHDLSSASTAINMSLVSAKFSGNGNVDSFISSRPDGVDVHIEATVAGSYHVTVHHPGIDPIDFGFFAHSSTADVGQSVLQYFDTGVAGETNEVLLFAKDRYGNDVQEGGLSLAASAKVESTPEDETNISPTITDLANGQYAIHWSSTLASTYLLHVSDVGSSHVTARNSPARTTIMPAAFDHEQSGFEHEPETEVLAGDAQNPVVIERDEFGNPLVWPAEKILSANVTFSDGHSVAVPVSSNTTRHEVEVARYLTTLGAMQINVYANMEAIASATYDVKPGHPSPATSFIEVHHTDEPARVGEDFVFTIILADRFGNRLTTMDSFVDFVRVDIVHSGTPNTPAVVFGQSDSLQAFLVPRHAGAHQIYVYYRDIQLSSTPFSLSVLPGEAFGPFSYGLGESLRTAIAGHSQHFVIRTRDSGSNDLGVGGASVDAFLTRHVGLHSDSTSSFEIDVTDNLDGTYAASYNVTESGEFSLFIRVNSKDVQGSPFVVTIHPDEISEQSLLHTENIVDENPVAGAGISLIFEAKDAFGNRRMIGGDDLMASFVHVATQHTTFAEIVDHQTGAYNISAFLIEAGEYTINVSCGENTVPLNTAGDTFTLIPGSSYPDHASLHGSGMVAAMAGEAATVILQMRDFYFNEVTKGGDVVTARIVQSAANGHMPTAKSIPIDISDLGNGTYTLVYTPFISGDYVLEVKLDRNGHNISHVEGSPSMVNVQPSMASAGFSYVAKTNRTSCEAGSTIPLVLHTKDEYENTCLKGGARIGMDLPGSEMNLTHTYSVLDQHNGLYLVRINPQLAGTFQVEISVNDEPLHFDNVTLDVLPTETSAVYSSSPELELIHSIEAGETTSFAVLTRDRYGNPTAGHDGMMSVVFSSHGSDHVVFGEYQQGIAQIKITTGGSGYINVTWNQELIHSQEIEVEGTWTSPLHTTVRGPGTVRATAGKVAYFQVVPIDIYGNPSTKGPVNVEVIDHNDFLLSTTYEEAGPVYNVSYIPSVTGGHEVHLFVGDKMVAGSPFSVLVDAGPTDPVMCQVLGSGIVEARVGHTNEFMVIARDGLGNLRAVSGDIIQVKALNPNEIPRLISFDVHDLGVGMYKISYVAPTYETELAVVVLINGDFAGGKNYTVDVVVETSIHECMSEDCSGHGTCNNRTGICACHRRWIGPDCSVQHLPCPSNCSFRGRCDSLTGSCFCDRGFHGDACQCSEEHPCDPAASSPISMGPQCFQSCSGHGTCVADETCLCEAGFVGRGCEIATEYRIVTMENGFGALYEAESGRLFGLRINSADDHSCSGLVLLDDAQPRLHNTSFESREPHMALVHVGENKIFELNMDNARSNLLSFRASDLHENSVGHPTSQPFTGMPALANSELTYLGMNRLMESSEQESHIWVVDRQNEDLLVNEVTSHTWDETDQHHYEYVGSNLIARYSSAGAYSLFFYNRATGSISEAPVYEDALNYLSDIGSSGTMSLHAFPGHVWIAMNPRTTDYRAYYCPTSETGFTGCTYINKGNILNGYECPTTLMTEECQDLDVTACIKSDRCGYCVETESCLAGTETRPSESTCDSGWLYSVKQAEHKFEYMGGNHILDFEPETGTYTIWSLDRVPRSDACPALSQAVASGFLADTSQHQVLFAGEDMINFNSMTGEVKIGSCDHEATKSDRSLKCGTWGFGVWDELRFRTVEVLSDSPVILLDYSRRTGEYRVWRLGSRAEYETGKPLLGDSLAEGTLLSLKDADVAALTTSSIIVHHPIDSRTDFVHLNASYNLVSSGHSYMGGLDMLAVGGVQFPHQYTYSAIGSNSVIQYDYFGSWKVLECHRYPVPNDVFGGLAALSCFQISAGTTVLPDCPTRHDEISCTSNSHCGWCTSSKQCSIGDGEGQCSIESAECPENDWVYGGPAAELVSTYSSCELAASCKECVLDSACGWHGPSSLCLPGSPSGPKNTTFSIEDAGDWNYYYCKGRDACESFEDCGQCTLVSYCGWCPGTSQCMAGTATGAIFATCPESPETDRDTPGAFYFENTQCPSLQP